MQRPHSISRRDWLRHSGLGLVGASLSGWFPRLAQAAAATGLAPRRQAILLWMAGGPSQLDTFDMKPDHANGGLLKEAATNVPGLRFSEHLPKLAQQADRLGVIRSIVSKEGDHARATQLARTGHAPGGEIDYPSIACSLAGELPAPRDGLPPHIAIASPAFAAGGFGPGFLGPRRTPAAVEARQAASEGYASLQVENLDLPGGVDAQRFAHRERLWQTLQSEFLHDQTTGALASHDGLHREAIKLMQGSAREAFNLDAESAVVRDAYGRGRFGQGCLLARRLIERGVPFVEVTLGGQDLGWDTHADGFRQVQRLSEELDNGWGTLMQELASRGLLETTTILCIGEFGRTPRINDAGGRDHFPDAWSCVLGGGGVAGGQAYGSTSEDGMTVVDGKVSVAEVLATFAAALGIDPATENVAGGDRPIKISEAEPIAELLA
ncbi:DUF1501 domain-containing protein [Botrimarina hoheduenensis]|uniref:DUF1501 domain-containing protein n=1 Tax=Botrimarina hoheduenensis TaxID=2528000 RepID=A0A5C5WEH8_9BACT|nr:DUF1501 domain-containing protein [Botrimarina hoheduenensis]TWT48455.1 hypothetical protein Pla111_02230 [Botrimarina hoheduenensis]